VRKAIDATIDRAALVAAVSDGVHIPQSGLVPPVFGGWENEQPADSFDLDEARRLYEEAGKPHIEVLYWEDRQGAAVADYLRQSCAAAGITLSSRAVATDEWFALFEDGTPPAVYLTGWLADYPGYDNFLYEPFLSSLSSISLGTGYADPAVDRLLTLARSTADPARHLDLSKRAAHEILNDKPVLPLFEFADYRLLSARVRGFSVSPTYGVDAWKLWVK
jgi:ABC-type transport system substrate-binding protein